jgi:hypothetical protein
MGARDSVGHQGERANVLRRLLSHITYGNVVASAALFIALGGVSYAAIKLPKNSVGAKQIKANSITSAKVKNRSLGTSDFGRGALAAVKGAPGAPGAQGPKGDKGDTGKPVDRGLLDSANWLGGTAAAQISIDGSSIGVLLKGYRVDCDNPSVACTLKAGGPMTSNIEYDAWHELSRLGDEEAATKSFSITEFAQDGSPVRRYHVTNGMPIAYHTQNDRFEITWTAEFIQRVSV